MPLDRGFYAYAAELAEARMKAESVKPVCVSPRAS